MYFSIARMNKELNLQTGVLSRLTLTFLYAVSKEKLNVK